MQTRFKSDQFNSNEKTPSHTNLVIRNAHTNNLRNISLEIPKHKLVVFTGVSGSGKSSLLFDTIYTEAQRQLIETFSAFARTRMPKLSRPEVDDILNLSTAIVIDQKKLGNNLRSTVGTATEIITYLRLLFSRVGKPFIGPSFYFSFNHPEGMCPACNGLGKQVKVDIDMFLNKSLSLREGAITHPHYKVGGFLWKELITLELFDNEKPLSAFTEQEINKLLYAEPFKVDSKKKLSYNRTFEGLARKLENAAASKAEDEAAEEEKNAYTKYFTYFECDECRGSRLNKRARDVKIQGMSLDELCRIELSELLNWINSVHDKVSDAILGKAKVLLEQLVEIGVGYLSLERPVGTLSGGESQRVKMARQFDCNLVDMLYILDEPSIGLHPRDTEKMLNLLVNLRDKGNSVYVVEHDPDIIRAAEWIVDIGPEAGKNGGEVVYNGPAPDIYRTDSLTAKYLAQKPKHKFERKKPSGFFTIDQAKANNLKNLSVQIPKGILTCITGVAGSGKSSLIHECFVKSHPEAIVIDQSPIGKSSRANPATYIGMFHHIRKEFAQATNSKPSLFSFNSRGACPKCKGQGKLSMELFFLDDVKMTCDECEGKRYHSDVLELRYQSQSIADVLDMTVNQAAQFFTNPKITKSLELLKKTGLGYLKLGQSLSTLSGGESQRLKIASELHKESNIYVMDEPTTGLHMSDIDNFYRIVKSLVDNDNTVIIIEHNLDIIKYADWIIDMGPEGGCKGGEILFEGLPEELVRIGNSHTGRYLKEYLD